jgi:orotate phosphoribosyltransferase
MGLFQLGDFTLNSGARSAWKLECDALTDDDWKCLAEMIRQMVGPFSSVEGVPRGGLKLAECLQPFVTPLAGYHLVVDDVLTTGRSMERLSNEVCGREPGGKFSRGIIGAVVFARGPCPLWVKPLFQLPEPLWLKAAAGGGPNV